MNQPTELNLTDEWENIVNENARRRSPARERGDLRKKVRRIQKLQLVTLVLASAAILITILGVAGALCDWLAITATGCCVSGACVAYGRFAEARE